MKYQVKQWDVNCILGVRQKNYYQSSVTWQQITGVSQRSTSTFYRTYECTCIVKNNATVLRVCFNGKIRGNVWRSFRAANASVTASYSWIQGWADSRNEIHIRSLLLYCHAWCVRPLFFSSFSLNRAISLLSTVLNLMAVRNQESSRIELMTKDSGSNSRFFPPSGRLHCSQLNCTYLFKIGKRGHYHPCNSVWINCFFDCINIGCSC